MIDVAVVLPLYDNAATLQVLLDRCRQAVPDAAVVLVDDACPRGSGRAAEALAAAVPDVTVVHHERNRGQQAAIRTGLAAMEARAVVVLDADLQDPPEAIPQLLARLGDGDVEAVFAGRRGAYEQPLRRLGGMAHRAVLAATLGLPLDAGGFVALSRRCAAAVLAMDGPPQLVAMIGRTGLPTASVPVHRDIRPVGSSRTGGSARRRHAANAVPHIHRALRARLIDVRRSHHGS